MAELLYSFPKSVHFHSNPVNNVSKQTKGANERCVLKAFCWEMEGKKRNQNRKWKESKKAKYFSRIIFKFNVNLFLSLVLSHFSSLRLSFFPTLFILKFFGSDLCASVVCQLNSFPSSPLHQHYVSQVRKTKTMTKTKTKKKTMAVAMTK